MHVPTLLIILPAIGLLAAPLTSEAESGVMNTKRDLALPFPSGQTADTCPHFCPQTGCDFYDGLEPQRRKRSEHVTEPSTSPLLPRSLCGQIAQGHLNGYAQPMGNTAEHVLLAGASYVFSWAFNEIVSRIVAFRNDGNGQWTEIEETGMNQGSGTMTIEGAGAPVHFVIFFGNNPFNIFDITGEFALFQVANGDQNPDK